MTQGVCSDFCGKQGLDIAGVEYGTGAFALLLPALSSYSQC